MRTIKLISGIAKDADLTKFPDSTIVNETETSEGTPVIREIYSDILTNIYKILRVSGITANGDEDSETDGYQLVDALRKFTNELNDVEQQLNLIGDQFSIALDLSLLPNKYVCFARAVEDYVSSTNYTFKGSNATVLPFTSPVPFKSGDVVLLIIDILSVRAYSIVPAATTTTLTEIFTPFGLPVAYNNSNKIWYQEDGVLMSDLPEVYDLQAAIRLAAADGTLLVYEMLVINSFVYCLVFAPNTLIYTLSRFSLSDLNTPLPVTLIGDSFPTGVNRKPNIYTDGETIFISNNTGKSNNNYFISKFTINHATGELNVAGSVNLDAAFAKSTNCVVLNNSIYELVNGQLNKYNLGTGVRTSLGNYPGNVGLLFNFKNNAYFSNGDVSKLWILN